MCVRKGSHFTISFQIVNMASFYVHLESNSSFSHFEDNTISTFRNWLSSPIILEPDSFEVALVECSYPSSPVCIMKGANLFKAMRNYIQFPDKTVSYFSAPTNIKSLNELLKSLNDNNKEFTISVANGFAVLTPKMLKTEPFAEHDGIFKCSIEFSPHIASILGFTNHIDIMNETIKADHEIEYKCNNSRYFVYSDLVENQHVGDTMAPLLRSFDHTPLPNEQMICKAFNNLQYISVAKPEFDFIYMYIRNEFADPPPFTFGSFSATLHFRRKRF